MMKALIALFVVMMPLAAADVAPGAKKPAPVVKAAAKPVQAPPSALQVPDGAVETAPETFRYTDAQGKKWVYRKTPFGVARMEDTGEAHSATSSARPVANSQAAPTAAQSQSTAAELKVKVEDRGDTVHFERPGPFGMYKWDRAKSELTAEERGWLENSRAAKTKN